jgi:hypothetical protein
VIESINIKPLVIQEGRRYEMRYGGITAPVTKDGSGFTDGMFSWFSDGRYYSDRENGRDLIREYIPQPEPLPFVLKAGGKYETVKPGGSAGPVVELVANRFAKAIAPFYCLTAAAEWWVSVAGLVCRYSGGDQLRIVREHVPLTPIERLEMAVGSLASHDVTDCVRQIRGVIADLKATVKP